MKWARPAGFCYLLTFVSGSVALLARGPLAAAAGLIAAASYLAVTVLFYHLFKPVNPALSLVAACISVVGIALGPLQVKAVNPLVFFGFYCLLVGYLIARSTFLPRILGGLMMLASLGWLTFLGPLGRQLFPYNLAPGVIGEGSLMMWLLVVGVNAHRWQEQAAALDDASVRT